MEQRTFEQYTPEYTEFAAPQNNMFAKVLAVLGLASISAGAYKIAMAAKISMLALFAVGLVFIDLVAHPVRTGRTGILSARSGRGIQNLVCPLASWRIGVCLPRAWFSLRSLGGCCLGVRVSPGLQGGWFVAVSWRRAAHHVVQGTVFFLFPLVPSGSH